MAAAIADEYARMGTGRAELMALFRDPVYLATHALWRARGEAAIARLVDEAVRRWGGAVP
jgi:hypothetical protein